MNIMRSTNDIQKLREKYIRMLSDAEFPSEVAREFSDELFSLDLTVYSKNYSFDSIIYNSFAKSNVDNGVSLHPEQMEIIEQIEENNALIHIGHCVRIDVQKLDKALDKLSEGSENYGADVG